MKVRHFVIGSLALAGGFAAAGGPAFAQSIEDRLRSQLRETVQQLRQLQDNQAQLQTQATEAQQARDKAQAELKQAQAELAAAKAKPDAAVAAERALAAEKASHAQDSQQLAGYKSAYEDLLALSRSRDAQAKEAQDGLKARDVSLQACEAKNARLYQVGHDILDAYEHVGLGTFLKSREPFAQAARVKYDEIAQDFGDQLYGGKFDPRATPPQTASAPPASK